MLLTDTVLQRAMSLLTDILRGEWGFQGMVTTDWWTFGEHYRETKAGNDIKMAAGYPERIKEASKKVLLLKKKSVAAQEES